MLGWTGEKRPRKYLPLSSSGAPATYQDHGDPISHADMEHTIQLGGQEPISHATDMEHTIQLGGQEPIFYATDMEDTVQWDQDQDLLLTTDSAQEESQEIFGSTLIISEEDQAKYAKLLLSNIPPPPPDLKSFLMTWEERAEVKARFAHYRIAHYKAVNPECAHELKEPDQYTENELREQVYFEWLEKHDNFEWYVHGDDLVDVELNDYQRITPCNYEPSSGNIYCFHDEYRSRYHTYKIDAVYVKYYAEISKKIKWIAGHLRMDRETKGWIDLDTRAWRQALKIATRFPHMTVRLAAFAYHEFIYEMEMDVSLKDIDLLYFEIWRRVTKENKSYIDAVKEVYASNEFPVHKGRLDAELTGGPHTDFLTMKQLINSIAWMGDIDLNTELDKARDVFRKLAFSKHKAMNMAQYAQKKLQIADQLKLNTEDGFVPLRPGML